MTGLSVRFHNCIERANCLTAPTKHLANFFDAHPTAYKIALIINHLFRAVMMVGLMFIPQVPLAISMGVCLVGSLFYRLTVERNCAYKFALPAFAGAAAFMLALPALINILNGGAFVSLSSTLQSGASLIPLAIYGTYIVLTVDYDVDKMLGLLPVQKPLEECQCSAMRGENQGEGNQPHHESDQTI